MIMGAALFRGRARTALAGALGGLAPDAPSFVLVGIALARGTPPGEIFEVLYFSPGWQAIMAPSHSAPLWTACLAAALMARWSTGAAFFASGLLHGATDFLTHAEDPHRHFWPLSDWRFESPVSYWDPEHYGGVFAPAEIALAVLLSALLLRRYRSRWLAGALGLVVLAYAAQYVVSLYLFGGGGPPA
jgi:hypothetical protein